MTISNWHKKWSKFGIVDKEKDQEPYEHLISLKDAGLECPHIPEPHKKAEEDDKDE